MGDDVAQPLRLDLHAGQSLLILQVKDERA